MDWTPVASFYVEGEPKGQPRPRFDIRGRRPRAYDPGTADAWRGLVTLAARRHTPAEPIDRAAWVVVSFYFPAPRSTRHPAPEGAPKPHTAKPDIDNALKVILDALTDAGFWKDDSLVVSVDAIKYYATETLTMGASIEVFRETAES